MVRAWFDRLMAGGGDFGVPSTVWASFLRLVTNRRIFDMPTTAADAFAFIEAVRLQPGYLPTEPGPRHWVLLQRLCEEADVLGDLVPDAVIGAIAVEHAAQVATLDRDFARFAEVDAIRPT